MTSEQLLARITINPAICHGKPCIRNLRSTLHINKLITQSRKQMFDLSGRD